jgi:S1-C subfamily serine protease
VLDGSLARRLARFVAGALSAAAAVAGTWSCADDGPAAAPDVRVVAVAAQPCDRPLPAEGVGVVLGDGVVITAGHVVEGLRRSVTVDGADATVVAVDPRTDLAVLRADVAGAADLGDEIVGSPHVAAPAGDTAVTVTRTGPLVVHDTTDRVRYEREVHVVRPDVPEGTSGAPLVDEPGTVAGIVVLVNRRDGTSYAVTAAEVRALLAANRDELAAEDDEPAPMACPD